MEYIEREALVSAAKKYGITLPSIMMNAAPTYTPAEIMAMQWAPASERLPPKAGESVIVRFDGKLDQNISAQGALQIGCFWPDEQKWDIEGWPIALGTVTHWMPLPDLPKEAQHD